MQEDTCVQTLKFVLVFKHKKTSDFHKNSKKSMSDNVTTKIFEKSKNTK